MILEQDRYSRMVSLLKVIFPLAALAILSTLFLLSRSIDSESAIPFAEKEIQDRLRDQQITGPFFSGTSADGDQLSFSAVRLITPEGRAGANKAEKVVARIETATGVKFVLKSNVAQVDIADDSALLEGDVTMSTSTGYRIDTARLSSQISAVQIVAPDTVRASGPLGKLTAGNMRLDVPEAGANTQMLFSGGVKLVYTPN